MDLSNFGIGNEKKKIEENSDSRLDLNLETIKDNLKNDQIERFLPWFLKYQLKKFDDLIVTKEIKKIIDFIENKPKKKGLLLVGKAGSGKTTTLNLLAEKYDFEIFEVNASDSRNKKTIDATIGDVLKQKSLFAKKKLILVDEVDGVSGTKDRGGVVEIIKYIKLSNVNTPYLVFTANDSESDKIKALKKSCITIDFENHSNELLLNIGKRILNNENINFKEDELIEFIEKKSTIDIRGFINDLQASCVNSKFVIDSNLELRNYKKKMENILEKIYYSYPEDALFSSFNSDINLDDLFLYLEENTSKVYTDKSLMKAFNDIAKADVFRGRIMKYQYFRFLVYINFYLTFAISSDKTNSISKIKDFKRNERILKKWIYSNKYNSIRPRTRIEKSKNLELKFIERLAKYYSVSASKCRSNDLFYFAFIYKNNSDFQEEMNIKLNIDDVTKKCILEL